MPDEQKKEPKVIEADFSMKPTRGNAEREQEELQEQLERVDQYSMTGAMNYAMALAMALAHFNQLRKEIQDDLVFVIVTRMGAIQAFGGGEHFPTNEEMPVESGFFVSIDDIEAEIKAEKEDAAEE